MQEYKFKATMIIHTQAFPEINSAHQSHTKHKFTAQMEKYRLASLTLKKKHHKQGSNTRAPQILNLRGWNSKILGEYKTLIRFW